MNISEFEKHVGKVVLLDLVSGMQVCAKIKELQAMASKVIISKGIIFQIAHEPADPTQAPSSLNPMKEKLKAHPFNGGPFALPATELPLDAAHIMGLHIPVDAIEKSYLQTTSGIEIAGAGALNGPSGLVR